MLRSIVLFISASVLFHSCSTEFDLTGQYIDKAVVYGILDPADNPNAGGAGHLFRVQKMFLGQASAFDMALVPDSSYFKYDELTVNLVEFDDNDDLVGERFPMDTISIDTKEEGDPNDDDFDFFAPKQRLYRSDRNIDPDKEYGVEVIKKDLTTQDTIYFADARTTVVDLTPFRFENPSSTSPLAQQMDIYSQSSQEYKDYTLRFRTANNAAMYEVWLRFHYREVINGVETAKSIEWLAASVDVAGAAGGQSTQVPLNGESIIAKIGDLVEPNPDAVRIIGIERDPETTTNRDLDVIVRMGGQSLFDFLEVNSSNNTSAVQDKPVFTNINNGLGLFSSRTSASFTNAQGLGVYFPAQTLAIIESSSYTAGLNFVREQ
jgi:hypothetical protein